MTKQFMLPVHERTKPKHWDEKKHPTADLKPPNLSDALMNSLIPKLKHKKQFFKTFQLIWSWMKQKNLPKKKLTIHLVSHNLIATPPFFFFWEQWVRSCDKEIQIKFRDTPAEEKSCYV